MEYTTCAACKVCVCVHEISKVLSVISVRLLISYSLQSPWRTCPSQLEPGTDVLHNDLAEL